MSEVVIDMSISLDGFVAGPNDGRHQGLGGNGGEHLHDWLFSGSEPSRYSDFFRPEGANREIADRLFETTGVMLTGRRTYDITAGWGGEHPIKGITVVVLTHRPPSIIPVGPTRFIFCDRGVEAGVALAKQAAGAKQIIVQGASVCRQVLRANLADRIELHIAPIILGGGVRLFGEGGAMRLELIEQVTAPHAIHARYKPL
jgi:dihydrofolate reductase